MASRILQVYKSKRKHRHIGMSGAKLMEMEMEIKAG